MALVAYASVHVPLFTLSPFSVAAAIPAYVIFEWVHRLHDLNATTQVLIQILGAFPLAISFWIWSYPLFRGAMRIPWRSRLLYICVAAASAYWTAVNWHLEVEDQGLAHISVMIFYNTLAALALGALWYRSRRGDSFAISLAFQAGLFLWLAWSALAWLGEWI